MHKHTIDWLRQTNLTSDATLAEKRWETAEKYGQELSRSRIIDLLRLFLLTEAKTDFAKKFTEEILEIDAEFPVSDNFQELRLMAGLVIAAAFDEPSHEADAFALGIHCANFPAGRTNPIQTEIAAESELYLRNEADRLRPNDFHCDTAQITKKLSARAKGLAEALMNGDAAKQNSAQEAFRASVIETIADSHDQLSKRTRQLAEETGLLWWAFNEFSDVLTVPTRELSQDVYAFPAAIEAADRTHIYPPPPSINPLLRRALRNCAPPKDKPTLSDYLEHAGATWRQKLVKGVTIADCRDLVPILAGLEKKEELDDTAAAIKALSKLCTGVTSELVLSPAAAAEQLYAEIIFIRVLCQISTE